MARYVNGSNATWSANVERLRDTFERWGVNFEDWTVECAAKGAARNSHAYSDTRAVTVRYRLPGRQNAVKMTLDSQEIPARNLNSILITIEAIRMQERCGLGAIAAAHYLALAAPITARDPYEVLGLRPDASAALIEAAYKALAKERHPDTGGTDDAMTELSEAKDVALERVR